MKKKKTEKNRNTEAFNYYHLKMFIHNIPKFYRLLQKFYFFS